MQFKRGATPTITFQLDVSPELFSICHITFQQYGKIRFIKTLADCTLGEGNTLLCRLTEEETLSLKGDAKVKIQLRVAYLDGQKDASDILEADVGAILEEGVLTDGIEG
ncbi:MAG: hypothetical protein MR278_09480 [Bacteroidales bacterium]|nr:hypothetical protein [Anaerotignum sp.]MCI5680184.1 hypothetical protein [Bacteroidales bacterium]MDY3926875.1 hypothetical protein [Anaerotignum sp.]